MAGISGKPDRDRTLEFQGFLDNLQDWETSRVDREKKPKSQAEWGSKVGSVPQRKVPIEHQKQTTGGAGTSARVGAYDYSSKGGVAGYGSHNILIEETTPDASSEKELGNEYFKQKNFHKAIECYSRSIALSPTAVAFANRAMAYLKIKRYEDAENDCTEALDFDDRYVKAYSRRATARKELGKLKESIEDCEFALRLEPNNQELQKLYSETKSRYEKARKIPETSKNQLQGIQVVDKPDSGSGDDHMKTLTATPRSNVKITAHSVNEKAQGAIGKPTSKASMEEVVARASSLVTASKVKDITTPRSCYEFEVSWRALSHDSALQSSLLKGISPASLPQLFKTALSAPLLIDIIKSIATFFSEETEFAVKFLDNLTKVPRFDMVVMCFSALDRADLTMIWNDVFCGQDVPAAQLEAMIKLKSKFLPSC